MAVEVNSSSRPADRITYKRKRRVDRETTPPAANKRIKVLRDHDSENKHPSLKAANDSPLRNIRRNLALSSSSSSTLHPSDVFLPKSATGRGETTGQILTASSPIPLKAPPSSLIVSMREHGISHRQLNQTPRPALTSPVRLSNSFQLASPFKGDGRKGPNTKQKRRIPSSSQTHSTHTQTLARHDSFAQSRNLTVEDASVNPSKSKRRTASGAANGIKNFQRDSSWLVAAASLKIPHPRTPKKITSATNSTNLTELRGKDAHILLAKDTPFALAGMESFFSGAPDAFSTPIRAPRSDSYVSGTPGKDEDAMDDVTLKPTVQKSLSSTPNLAVVRSLELGGHYFRLSTPPLYGTPSPSQCAQRNRESRKSRPTATHHQRAQRTTDKLPAPLTNSPTTRLQVSRLLVRNSNPELNPTPPKAQFHVPTSHYATMTNTLPNLGPLTPAHSPIPSQYSTKSKNMPHIAGSSRTPDGDAAMQADSPRIEGSLSNLTISDGLTIVPHSPKFPKTRPSHRVQSADTFSIKEQAGQRGPKGGARKKSGRTILQTDDEYEEDEGNASLDNREANVDHGRWGSGEGNSPMHKPKRSASSGARLVPNGVSAKPGQGHLRAVHGRSSSTSTTSSVSTVSESEPRTRYCATQGAHYIHNMMDDDSDDELLLKHGQTKQSVFLFHEIMKLLTHCEYPLACFDEIVARYALDLLCDS